MGADPRLLSTSTPDLASRLPVWGEVAPETKEIDAVAIPYFVFKGNLDELLASRPLIIEARDRFKVGLLKADARKSGIPTEFLNQIGFIEILPQHPFHHWLIEQMEKGRFSFPNDKVLLSTDDWKVLRPKMMSIWLAKTSHPEELLKKELSYVETKYGVHITTVNTNYTQAFKKMQLVGPNARCNYLLELQSL